MIEICRKKNKKSHLSSRLFPLSSPTTMPEALKNAYSPDYVTALAKQFKAIEPSFKRSKFIKNVFDENWGSRELKDRMRHISMCMGKFLPSDYPKAVKRLRQIADLDRPSSYSSLADMCFPDFIEVHGLNDPDISLPALGFLTRFSSSEFAIRPFIIKYPEITMAQMRVWALNENHHIRRLASEGCRPRLPWAMALPEFKKDPAPILPILELLKEDESDYVRRSVANNLNDIAKDHPELVLEIGENWLGKSVHTDWIIKHASRTLLKQGHSKALALFGFTKNPQLKINEFNLSTSKLAIGERMNFSFSIYIESKNKVKLRIEYGIYYMKANGKLSRKVFYITEGEYSSNSTQNFYRKQSFANLSTRKHYPGSHKIVLIINGIEMLERDFELTGV